MRYWAFALDTFHRTAGAIIFRLLVTTFETLLIRLAYFNVLEEERQHKETGSRTCYLGLPVTSVALFLPAFLMIGEYLLSGSAGLMPVLLIVMAAAFVLPIRVKKPRLLGKIGIVFTGIVEFVILLMGLGMEI